MDKKYFIEKYNIKLSENDEYWEVLFEIYNDYLGKTKRLNNTAINLFNKISEFRNMHSIRKRIKDPEHLIEKIIRKENRGINKDNYFEKVTDLIGIRILHLYKNDWIEIHNQIMEMLNEPPIEISVKYRAGDDLEIYKKVNDNLKFEEHKAGYRSVHYLIRENYNREERHTTEIQVRTVFEEAWSEIDHNIRYPYEVNNSLLNNFLKSFNTMAKSADDMGTFAIELKKKIKDFEAYEKLYKNINNEQSGIGKISIEYNENNYNFLEEEIKCFEGIWKNVSDNTGTLYYFKYNNNTMDAPYCYRGDIRRVTGHYFNIFKVGKTYYSKFEWLENKRMKGYAFWNIIDNNKMIGGWSMADSVTEEIKNNITNIRNASRTVKVELVKISDSVENFPKHVKEYFKNKTSANTK